MGIRRSDLIFIHIEYSKKLTDIDDALLGGVLASVPVTPVAKLLFLGFAVAENDWDDSLDLGGGMGPGCTADFAEIDGVELSWKLTVYFFVSSVGIGLHPRSADYDAMNWGITTLLISGRLQVVTLWVLTPGWCTAMTSDDLVFTELSWGELWLGCGGGVWIVQSGWRKSWRFISIFSVTLLSV